MRSLFGKDTSSKQGLGSRADDHSRFHRAGT